MSLEMLSAAARLVSEEQSEQAPDNEYDEYLKDTTQLSPPLNLTLCSSWEEKLIVAHTIGEALHGILTYFAKFAAPIIAVPEPIFATKKLTARRVKGLIEAHNSYILFFNTMYHQNNKLCRCDAQEHDNLACLKHFISQGNSQVLFFYRLCSSRHNQRTDMGDFHVGIVGGSKTLCLTCLDTKRKRDSRKGLARSRGARSSKSMVIDAAEHNSGPVQGIGVVYGPGPTVGSFTATGAAGLSGRKSRHKEPTREIATQTVEGLSASDRLAIKSMHATERALGAQLLASIASTEDVSSAGFAAASMTTAPMDTGAATASPAPFDRTLVPIPPLHGEKDSSSRKRSFDDTETVNTSTLASSVVPKPLSLPQLRQIVGKLQLNPRFASQVLRLNEEFSAHQAKDLSCFVSETGSFYECSQSELSTEAAFNGLLKLGGRAYIALRAKPCQRMSQADNANFIVENALFTVNANGEHALAFDRDKVLPYMFFYPACNNLQQHLGVVVRPGQEICYSCKDAERKRDENKRIRLDTALPVDDRLLSDSRSGVTLAPPLEHSFQDGI